MQQRAKGKDAILNLDTVLEVKCQPYKRCSLTFEAKKLDFRDSNRDKIFCRSPRLSKF